MEISTLTLNMKIIKKTFYIPSPHPKNFQQSWRPCLHGQFNQNYEKTSKFFILVHVQFQLFLHQN